MERNPRSELNPGSDDFFLLSREMPSISEKCRLLEEAEITSCRPLYSGSNIVFLAELDNGDKKMRAVYKPRRGEAPLYDFPDGTLFKREYAAFLLSLALEWLMIPPTVIRSGPHGVGSVQWFVETGSRLDYFKALRSIHPDELKQVALFDYVTNNADRKTGHCLPGADGRLWLVDHGLTFNAVPKLRTVIWDFAGQPVPGRLVKDVADLRRKLAPGAPLREALSSLLFKVEMEALENRIQRILSRPVFPQPSSHRSFPWPDF